MNEHPAEAEFDPRLAADPLIGMVVADRYRILSILGAGGMGVVYKVEHVHIGKLMAMKLLAGALSRDPAVIKRFKREALAASRLSHPNTVQVFDFGQANNLTYLVMELVAGDDLARVLRVDGPMPSVRMAKLLVQICGSLSEAHGAGIVHRDLKPENVLLVRSRDAKEELPKVCDFGVAKLRGLPEGSNDATNHDAVVGTPYYMAPEQIRGEDTDPRADIYALGAMMYRLLTGQPPFEGSSPMAVFAKHLTEAPQPPSERMPKLGIPRAADAVILKAMAKRREDRYASVDDLQRDLIDLLRAGNASSVDFLVDQGQIQALASQLASSSLTESNPQAKAKPRKAATRDEVAAYERKLSVQRVLGQGVMVLGLAGLAGGLWLAYRETRAYYQSLTQPPPPPEGVEREPNDEASKANEIPFGKEIKGQLGKRLAPDKSDRDFYGYDVPAGTSLAQLHLTALPNFATCLWVYRSGFNDPLARFCSGAPRQDLHLGAYRVEPGRYLLAVLQDTDPHGADATPPVHENISDSYTLRFEKAEAAEGVEVEPNDTPQTATRIGLGVEVKGTLNFFNDEDVICPKGGLTGSSIRWVVRDSVALVRGVGTALEVTFDRGGVTTPTRLVVHRAGSAGKPDATNVLSPHTTAVTKLDGAPATGCIKLKLTRDTWASSSKDPSPSDEPYSVKLESP